MPRDNEEEEIRLQFLEEAQEYLNSIESTLLNIRTQYTDGQIDSALRAAHSIKGGAAMMSFQVLSSLAHDYEDFFKIIKAQRRTLQVDTDLESLLLSGLDRLRQVATLNRQGILVDDQWAETNARPIFDRLHQRLDSANQSQEGSLLDAPEGEGEDIVALLFESEVEGSLQRIESVLDTPGQPCLREELSITAQEFGGLGEMLQLPAFTSLCESIVQLVASVTTDIEPIARAALQAWRRSQALVLVGQMESLPTHLALPTSSPPVIPSPVGEPVTAAGIGALPERETDLLGLEADSLTEVMGLEDLSSDALEDLGYLTPTSDDFLDEFLGEDLLTDSLPDPIGPLELETSPLGNAPSSESPIAGPWMIPPLPTVGRSAPTLQSAVEPPTPKVLVPETQPSPPETSLEVRTVHPTVVKPEQKTTAVEPRSEPVSTVYVSEPQDNTVRVSVRQLEQLGDLFGELTIERNGLGLNLNRMKNLVRLLSFRMRTLELANQRLRSAYDTVSTQGMIRAAVPAGATNGQATSAGSGLLDSTRVPDGRTSSLLTPHASYSTFDVLEMDRYSDLHLLSQEVMETIVQVQEVTSDIELGLEETDQTARDLNRTAKQMQTGLTQVRMRPLSDIVGRFPRALRELSLQYGKPVELKVFGSGTLIDRTILESMSDPMMHLLRNCFDHGIEPTEVRRAAGKPDQGTIEIRAAYRGNRTLITISDDGGGINLDKIRAKAEKMGLDGSLLATAGEREILDLIFEPGFSTAEQVTALSGRGVGMDVVRTNLRQIRGEIRVDTQVGIGTTFTITVPFTLSVVRVLLVESNGMMLAFPKDVIEEILLLEAAQVLQTAGGEFLNWESYMVPLIQLRQWLEFNCPFRPIETEDSPLISVPTVLMISQGSDLTGIRIDRCWGEQEVAIRQVEGTIPLPPGFAGCSILGDGRVVPLVDASALLTWIENSGQPAQLEAPKLANLGQATLEPAQVKTAIAATQTHTDVVLIVDDSINVRKFLALTLGKAGYRVEQAKDGQDALDKLMGGLQVQAVLCDIEMPRLDGFGFLARIKSEPKFEALPIAMLTSRIGDKHRRLGMSLGASAYFSKPFKEQELLQTLKQLIRH